MKKSFLTRILATLLLMGFIFPSATSQTCIADMTGTQRLSDLSWTSDDGGTCPPVSPYAGDLLINGPGNRDTLFINMDFEMTGTLTLNGLGNAIICIEEGATLTVFGDVVCMHPNMTIDLRGTLNVHDGMLEMKNNCFLCGTGIADIDSLCVKNNGTCDGLVEIHAGYCEAKNNEFCPDCMAVPLSVSLIDFSARELKEGIELSWKVADQGENSFYTVERSNGFTTWKLIRNVENSEGRANYSIIDPMPDIGVNHYRLSQTDKNGTSDHLSLVSVHYRGGDDMKIIAYDGRLTVQSFEAMEIHEVTIYDLRGSQHFSEITYMGNGLQYQMDISHLPFGIYIVKVEYPSGYYSRKIILTDDKDAGQIF